MYKLANHISNGRVHFGELCLAMLFMTGSYMLAGGGNLPNNTTLVYPLHKVSTLECRTLKRDTMPESCKIDLPIIRGANYSAYQDNKLYTDIYTVQRGASYSTGRDQAIGTHYATDIATAE